MIITGDERIGAAGRLGIYADAYFYRLLDALKEDFPAVLAVIGADQFHNLITGYLVAYPPSAPSLLDAGGYLAAYLKGTSEFAQWSFLHDLAHLERAMIESFHAPDAVALDGTAMQSIPPAEWPAMLMRLHPAVRLVPVGWRVDEVVRAVAQAAEPQPPLASETTLVVWRQHNEVLHRIAEPAEGIALGMIEAGADFASICEAIADTCDSGDTPHLINRLLARWLGHGLLLPPAVSEVPGASSL